MSQNNIRTISAPELKSRIDGGKVDVINVLASDYFEDCHITGSRNVPLAQLEERAAEWDKDKAIVLYCAKYECSASRDAFNKLKALGFENIWAYEGGIAEWKKLGLPCQGACAKAYLQG